MKGRPLTLGEVALARSMFGDAIDYAQPRIVRGKWAFFQPRETVMAPLGNVHFHPLGTGYRDDFAAGSLGEQGLLIHELVHVWQHQNGLFLPLQRHPFCRYRYRIQPGRPFERYGIEQQGEIVRHAFLLRHGVCAVGAEPGFDYEALLPFR
ncbi:MULTISPECIES: vgr related protein [Sphingomonas]|uniref:vgr related protein n=1 Tax=Sphingomonas TaxID=13687 RepID=UPI000837486B|nr:vgr related protein [Sphingomonas sp. CCH10-B3]